MAQWLALPPHIEKSPGSIPVVLIKAQVKHCLKLDLSHSTIFSFLVLNNSSVILAVCLILFFCWMNMNMNP